MKIGIIGLGKMGLAIAHRLIAGKHEILGFDLSQKSLDSLAKAGGRVTRNITDIATCSIIWLMVPAGKIVDEVLTQLSPHLPPKTIIVDGGNSNFHDTIKRAEELAHKNVLFVDCGTSGGLHGKEIGFSLMVGGDKQAYETIEPLLKSIAAPNGYAYMGPSGAGHYVKIIHNGIEYALLQAYANGFNLLTHGHYDNLDPEAIARVWSNGSVIRSWITELLHEIFAQNPDFTQISGAIGENKTGQWTLEEANKQQVDMPLLKSALETRKWSRETGGNYATKIVALLRNAFGGHEVK